MNTKKDNRPPAKPPDASAETVERRRLAKIVRDDRDTATVQWVAAPADHERIPLSIEGTLPRGVKRAPGGYNPYETISPPQADAEPDKRPAKRDLRKLSEWIKQMRELEERRNRGEED